MKSTYLYRLVHIYSILPDQVRPVFDSVQHTHTIIPMPVIILHARPLTLSLVTIYYYYYFIIII